MMVRSPKQSHTRTHPAARISEGQPPHPRPPQSHGATA
jgi:hypothetical protein